ncbi:MAG: phosphate signaling complex protein PhoU [Clostridia bacterium]
MTVRNKYEKEIKAISDELIAMQREVERAIDNSIAALIARNRELAKHTAENDTEINHMERDIEQHCLKVLLMEHPVASDFREITAALKMITDLERIGDQARDICEIVLQFSDEKYIKELVHIPQMAKIASDMVKDSVYAYVNADLAVATSLDKHDDVVDNMFQEIKQELIALVRENSDNTEQAMYFLMIAKYLERIADHAVNIGEWVEYALTGVRY